MKKIISNSVLTCSILSVCVFGYISLRIALLNYSIDYYELIDTRFITSGILYLILMSIIFFPIQRYFFYVRQFYSPLDERPLDLMKYFTNHNILFYTLILILFWCMGLYLYEVIIIEKHFRKTIFDIPDIYESLIAFVTILILPGVMIVGIIDSIKRVHLFLNICVVFVILIFSLILLSYWVSIAIVVVAYLVAFFGVFETVDKISDQNIRMFKIVIAFLSLSAFAIWFGKSILPLVKTNISPFSYRFIEFQVDPNDMVGYSLLSNEDRVVACVVFESKEDYYLLLDNSQDFNIIRVAKELIPIATYHNNKEAIDHCRLTLRTTKITD